MQATIMPLLTRVCRLIARAAAGSSSRRFFAVSACRDEAYGFIGLGRMGLPMAKNLRNKINEDDTLIVHDINTAATHAFVEAVGSKNTFAAEDVREVAEKSSTVITSLPEPSHVKAVFKSVLSPTLQTTDPEGPPRLFIDCSTIDPITSRAVAADVKSATSSSSAFVDAPMSGGVVGAEAGTLTFMLGSPPDLVERATEVLSKMGKRVVHLGDQGAGLAGKLANNYLLAVNNIATAEAMSMGIQWGLDPKALADMINTATGRCWPSEVNNPVPGVIEAAPASRGYEGGFGISLMKKDLGLALAAVEKYGVKNELGSTAMRVYEQASEDERCKGKDFASVYRWLDGPQGPPSK